MCNCGRTNWIFSSYAGGDTTNGGRTLWRRRPGGLLDGRGAPARPGSAAHEERGVRGQRGRRRLEVDVLDVDLGRDALGLSSTTPTASATTVAMTAVVASLIGRPVRARVASTAASPSTQCSGDVVPRSSTVSSSIVIGIDVVSASTSSRSTQLPPPPLPSSAASSLASAPLRSPARAKRRDPPSTSMRGWQSG